MTSDQKPNALNMKSNTPPMRPLDDQDHRLLSAFLAGDEDLRRGRRLGEGELAVHIFDEVFPERDQEEDSQKSAERGGEEHLEE